MCATERSKLSCFEVRRSGAESCPNVGREGTDVCDGEIEANLVSK